MFVNAELYNIGKNAVSSRYIRIDLMAARFSIETRGSLALP